MTLLTAKSRLQKDTLSSGRRGGEMGVAAQVGAVIAARLSAANCILSNARERARTTTMGSRSGRSCLWRGVLKGVGVSGMERLLQRLPCIIYDKAGTKLSRTGNQARHGRECWRPCRTGCLQSCVLTLKRVRFKYKYKHFLGLKIYEIFKENNEI